MSGILQLADMIGDGDCHARQVDFPMTGTIHKLEWLRIVGDLSFLVAGVIPITWAALRSFVKRDRLDSSRPTRDRGASMPRSFQL